MSAAELLQGYMDQHNIHQAMLARLTGFSTKTVNQVLRGHKRMSPEFAVACAVVLAGRRSARAMAERLLAAQAAADVRELLAKPDSTVE